MIRYVLETILLMALVESALVVGASFIGFGLVGEQARARVVEQVLEDCQPRIVADPIGFKARLHRIDPFVPSMLGAAGTAFEVRSASLSPVTFVTYLLGALTGISCGSLWRARHERILGHVKPSSTRIKYAEMLLKSPFWLIVGCLSAPFSIPLYIQAIAVYCAACVGSAVACRYWVWWL